MIPFLVGPESELWDGHGLGFAGIRDEAVAESVRGARPHALGRRSRGAASSSLGLDRSRRLDRRGSLVSRLSWRPAISTPSGRWDAAVVYGGVGRRYDSATQLQFGTKRTP